MIAVLLVAFAAPLGGLESTAVAQTKPVATASSSVLKKGSRGPRVRKLQRKLGIPADGAFGPQTERAVKSFQRRHGLTADGVVGPQTRAALGLGSGRVLKRKRSGGGGHHGGGRKRSILNAIVRAGNRIATIPYRYGGGH